MSKSRNVISGDIFNFITHHMYLLLLLPLALIIYPLLSPGVVLIADFPLLEASLFPNKHLATWNEFGSHFGFETLPRYPFIVLGYFLGYLQVGADVVSKFLVILGFSVASFSFYFSFLSFLKSKARDFSILSKVGAIIGSIFYAYNVWSFHRIQHWYLWFGYAILPLFLMLLVYSLKYPLKWRYIIPTVLIWTLVSGYPHMVIFYGLFFIGFSVFFILRNIRRNDSILNIVKPVMIILILYVSINVYWIYPYTLYILHSGTALAPSIYITEEYTKELSNDSSFLNVFRLIEDTWQPKIVAVNPPEESPLYVFWSVASFVPPIVGFSALLFTRKIRYVIPIFALSLVGILLTLGTNAPHNIYLFLLFEMPLSSILRFIFREPDKWAFLIALSYSFLMSVASFEILRRANNLKYGKIFASSIVIFVVGSLVIYYYPIYQDASEKVLSPVILPDEYAKLNSYLETSNPEKVFFLDQDFNPKFWNKERFFCCLDEVSSAKPNIDTYYPASENYHNYLKSILSNEKSKNISNLATPLGTEHLIYSNDEIEVNNTAFLKGLSSLGDINTTNNIGFFNVYKTDSFDTGQVNIPKSNILVSGGLDMFTSLNSLPFFSSKDSSLSFLDQNLEKEQKLELMKISDVMVLRNDGNDFIFSSIDNKYLLSPYDYTNHGGLVDGWSKDSSLSTGYGTFHSNSQVLGMESWNFDYGKGLVITQNPGANMTMHFNTGTNAETSDVNNDFYLFVRYFKNQKGGTVNILVDDTKFYQIDTLDRTDNYFKWEQIGVMNLGKGNHKITLKNIAGFNAINVLAIVPSSQITEVKDEVSKLLDPNTRIVHLLETESVFSNAKGKDVGLPQNLQFDDSSDSLDGTFRKHVTGQFTVPANSSLMSLEVLADKTDTNSTLSVNNLQITPVNTRYQSFNSDFEENNNSSKSLSQVKISWLNNNPDLLSITGTNTSISENKNLRIDIEQTEFTHWGVISTDYIPIEDNTFYNYVLGVTANNVNQLHSKIYYFDSNLKEIATNFVFDGQDGTFKDLFTKSLLSAKGAKYVKIQMWVKPNASLVSDYTLTDVGIEIDTGHLGWNNKDSDILSISDTDISLSGNKSLRVDIKQTKFTHWGVITSNYIPINGHAFYDLSLDFRAKDVNQLHSKVYYFDSFKNSISSEEGEFVLDGQDGSFHKKVRKYVTPPVDTKFIVIEVWVMPNLNTKSSYVLDNVNLEEIIPSTITFNGNIDKNNSSDIAQRMYNNTKINPIFSRDENSSQHYLQTELIPVEENHSYNYAMTLNGINVSSPSASISFRNSLDIVESSKYGNNASDGRLLTLSTGSDIAGGMDVVKSSNYTMALRAKTSENSSNLMVSVERKGITNSNSEVTTLNYSLKQQANFDWIFSNSTVFLEKGTYEISIYSNSLVDLDSVVLVSAASKTSASRGDEEEKYGINQNQFSALFGSEILSPAMISSYKKIGATKHVLNITNATSPYILSFAESYDNLWSYSITDTHNNNLLQDFSSASRSIPLYSVVNGFLINKTGDYTLTLEYQPQEWFVQAGIASIIALIVSISVILMSKSMKFFKLKRRFVRA